MPNPLRENQLSTFPPGASVAGIIARTDTERGIWKAPAGLDASFSGVQGFTYKLTDGENGILNPLGLNCLRSFPVYGNIVWGARTLDGADIMASSGNICRFGARHSTLKREPVPGLALGCFEPNDESLWSQIRLNAGNFMQDLFRKGAFREFAARRFIWSNAMRKPIRKTRSIRALLPFGRICAAETGRIRHHSDSTACRSIRRVARRWLDGLIVGWFVSIQQTNNHLSKECDSWHSLV